MLNLNSDIFEGKWAELRGEVKERWGKLTDSDLDKAAGRRDHLVGLLQSKYGYSRKKANDELDKFGNQYDDAVKELEARADEVVQQARQELDQLSDSYQKKKKEAEKLAAKTRKKAKQEAEDLTAAYDEKKEAVQETAQHALETVEDGSKKLKLSGAVAIVALMALVIYYFQQKQVGGAGR